MDLGWRSADPRLRGLPGLAPGAADQAAAQVLPRRTADPEKGLFTAEEGGNRAPETVREPVEPGVLETTVDEEAAELIQGPRHDAPPITSNVDRQAEDVMDEALGEPEAQDDTAPPRHARQNEGEVFQRERRRMAAAEHRRAAEEHRRAAEAMAPEEQESPAAKPADGRQQTRRGGTQPS